MISRRNFLAAAAAAPPAVAMTPARGAEATPAFAADEAHWRKVAGLFDPPPAGVIQLENGQFGAMARSTRLAFEQHTARVNRETTLYTRGPVNADLTQVRTRVAHLLQVDPDELAFTRGGTESMVTPINGYNRLRPGDAVLYADLDYDSMQAGMAALARRRGVRVVRIDLPEPADRQSLTDVLLDCGHALGQTEFSLHQLDIDFAGLNLHNLTKSSALQREPGRRSGEFVSRAGA